MRSISKHSPKVIPTGTALGANSRIILKPPADSTITAVQASINSEGWGLAYIYLSSLGSQLNQLLAEGPVSLITGGIGRDIGWWGRFTCPRDLETEVRFELYNQTGGNLTFFADLVYEVDD